jgi:ABC-type thiamine transport system ATPase subunit
MRKRGRPKVPKGKALTPGLSVRLTASERQAVDAAIARSGLTQSEWARKVLLSAAEDRKVASV